MFLYLGTFLNLVTGAFLLEEGSQTYLELGVTNIALPKRNKSTPQTSGRASLHLPQTERLESKSLSITVHSFDEAALL